MDFLGAVDRAFMVVAVATRLNHFVLFSTAAANRSVKKGAF
jgi:hypothetical protein